MEPIELGERLGRWPAGRGPLHVLLAARLRRLIDEGELPPGEPLPPDRALAAALAVGRSTVVAAYDLLRQDERIVRRQGSGTRVAGAEPGGVRRTTSAPIFLHLLEPGDGVIPLACAAPDTPPPELAQAYARIVPALAAPPATSAITRPATRRCAARSPTATPDAGSAPARSTSWSPPAPSRLCRCSPARCWHRATGYWSRDRPTRRAGSAPGAGSRAAFAAGRARQPGRGARAARSSSAYVISTFHNPTGSVLPPLARRALVQAAAAAGIPLIDDEVLSDLAFPGVQVPPPLAAYADGVISVGSLSKSIWGGLRIGWVRAPEPLIARLARLLAVHDLGGNVPAQLAAAELVPRLDELSARQAPARQARHDHLRAELARHLPGWDAPPVPGGQTLWVRLPYGDGTSFAQTALRHRVAILPGSRLDASGQSQDYLRLHFVARADHLTEAVRRLADAWRAYRPPPSPPSHPPLCPSDLVIVVAHGGDANT